MANLSTYLLQVRRLLHDATGQFYVDTDLQDFINEARVRTVMDTGCLRNLYTFTLTVGQENYPFSDVSATDTIVNVINVSYIMGTTRYSLKYYPFTDFNSIFRGYTNFLAYPVAFSVYGQNSFYVGPIPDQAYPCEVDAVYAPANLLNNSSAETIAAPYTDLPQFYAAYLAKLSLQSFEEAQAFLRIYNERLDSILTGIFTRR